jgi:hypothetical protein
MKKTFYLFSLIFLLNGCVESIALLSSTAGGAASGKLVQSSLQSTLSYGIKKQTGKTPLGHALAYAEKNNPEKKKETCISFIEKTRSEFCTIAKKKISLANSTIREKALIVVKKIPEITVPMFVEATIKPKIMDEPKKPNFLYSFVQSKKSARELAIAFQVDLKKKLKIKN